MISPYASDTLLPLLADTDNISALKSQAKTLPKMTLNSASAGYAVMLASGYFTPLSGYMHKQDVLGIADTMQTQDGLFFPAPIINKTTSVNAKIGDKIALIDPNLPTESILAIQTITHIDTLSTEEEHHIARAIYGTDDPQHPGVKAFLSQGQYLLAGPIEVLHYSYFDTQFPDTFRTAMQIREEIKQLGWKKIVAFQTRNPMHLAHEALCKMAMQATYADGCIIHMLLGKLKKGDIPAAVRDDAIRTMAQHYFPKDSVMIAGYGFDMLYAGPREALLHAIFRQNMGATHFIIGRDHAGVGDFYGAFDAQTIFDLPIVQQSLKIDIFKADHTAYSKKLHKVVMMRDAPDHKTEDFILLSGTKVREMLSNGIAPPKEFSRPEVAKILMDYYQNTSNLR